ncbi:MAG TPA: hypothetical protein EYF98_11480 [Planctomycetes bacterium]|nr:hypothetical protein [Planctomycetota bacterium]
MDEQKSYVWRGPDLNLKPPTIPTGDDGVVARIKPGASVTIVSADEVGALVVFPPCPLAFKLPRTLWEHVHDETSQAIGEAPTGDFGGWDGTTLNSKMLLRVLQHPNAVQIVTALVENHGTEAKEAVMPLIQPLVSALVPAEHMSFVNMALAQYIK